MSGFDLKVEGLHPAKDFMLVEPISGEQTTKSGIVLNIGPEGGVPTIGKVVRCGPDASYAVGSTLLFRRYSVDELEIKTVSGVKKLSWIQTEDVISEYKDNGEQGN